MNELSVWSNDEAKKWKNLKARFIGLKWTELFHDRTPDTYRPALMSPIALLDELIQISCLAQQDKVWTHQMQSTVDELLDAFEHNAILRSYGSCVDTLKSIRHNPRSCQYFGEQYIVRFSNYRDELFDEAKQSAHEENRDTSLKRKGKVEALLGLIASTTVHQGLKASYCQSLLGAETYDLDEQALLDHLQSGLDAKSRLWTCVYVLSFKDESSARKTIETQGFQEFQRSLAPSGGDAWTSFKAREDAWKQGKHTRTLQKTYEALRPQDAWQKGYEKLRALLQVIHFHGQQRPDIDVLQARFAFVPNERLGYFKEFDSGYKSVLQPQRHAFQKALDFHARHHDSALVDTLYRSLSFYVSAFHAEAVDVRFLTLWIALESLVKEVSEEKVYQRLEAGILPSLVSNRVNKITTYAAIALQENGALSPQQGERTNARHLKQSSPRFVEPVEVLHMLCFSERKKDSTTSKKPKYENQEIGELFGRCDEHVLLKHRLNSLWASMTERTTVHAQLNRSYQRSLWQLRRMYSARNLLVHHGIKSKHLEYLLKNLEYYYTSMVMHIMHDLQRTPHGFSSLASVLEARKWKWIENQRALKKDNGLALRAADFRMRSDHPDVSDEPLWER